MGRYKAKGINMQLNGRKIGYVTVTNVDTYDYPDFCDAYFDYAQWEDTGEDLTDDELVDLTEEYPDIVNQMAHEKAFC